MSNTTVEAVKLTLPEVSSANRHFFVLTNAGETAKWRKDKSIAMVNVVQKFEVYKGEHGTDGEKPSDQELHSAFGTSNRDDVIKRILEEGEISAINLDHPSRHVAKPQ